MAVCYLIAYNGVSFNSFRPILSEQRLTKVTEFQRVSTGVVRLLIERSERIALVRRIAGR